MSARWFALPLFVVLLVVACGDPDHARIDNALRERVTPEPDTSDILEMCDAMAENDWDIAALHNEYGSSRLVGIAAVVDNVRWDLATDRNTGEAWDWYTTRQDFRYYCVEKRREG